MISRKEIETIRQRYPKGSRIMLLQMADDPRPVPPGSVGVVDMVDDAGQVHAIWPGGRRLAVIPGVDAFHRVPPQIPKKEKKDQGHGARE